MDAVSGQGVRSARLLGREQLHYGSIAALAEGPLAIALSAGGAPKTYDHTDPNEDAVGLAIGPGGVLVAAGDAHLGASASERVLAHVLDVCATTWLGEPPIRDWSEQACTALWDAHMTLRRAALRTDPQGSRTTFVLALVRPQAKRLYLASIGDSHVFHVTPTRCEDLAASGRPCPPRYFLGSESLREAELAEVAVASELPVDGSRAVVLATDGLSERGVGVADPEAAVTEAAGAAARAAPDLRPLELARSVAQCANRAHRHNPSGDNIATAAIWLER